jgi:Enoyl-(Acyl carrier protein) reductase
LKGSVTQQVTDGAKIHACHNQPTGKSMPIAMPSVVRELGILEHPIKPVSLIAQLITLRVHEDPLRSWSNFVKLSERRERFLIQRNMTGVAVFRFWDGQDAPVKVDIGPPDPKSVASVKGTPAFGVYGATKAALRSFVRTWTSDLKDRHIRSNVVSPGPTDTPAIDGQPADAIARIVSTIPMGRMGESEEIAKAALFLASDDSSFVTGIELFVDGGRGQI